MSPIGFKTIRTSDLSGEELEDDKVVTLVVRHPDLEGDARQFDASPDELKGLKSLDDIVEIEIKSNNGTTANLLMHRDEFEAIVALDKLRSFPGTRGRRPGFRPGNGN